MKIKVQDKSYEDVMALEPYHYKTPICQKKMLRWLMKELSAGELKKTHFTWTEEGMERLGKDEPCLILMNHSAFIDLKIASTILYPRQFHIVMTLDGFVGKEGLMRSIGCIPAKKFIADLPMVKDIDYCFHTLNSSVLMYPEASYSFDGTATPLPTSVAKSLKIFKVPVVMIRTYGAFLHDPLYNGLQLRDVPVRAEMKYLLSPEEIKEKTVAELHEILHREFTFNHWNWQQENRIKIREPFRADGLDRVLYKCPVCGSENSMQGNGTEIGCADCGSRWTLKEEGALQQICGPKGTAADRETQSSDGATAAEARDFTSVPEWYQWERACVRRELEDGTYRLETPVRILALVNTEAAYHIGEGTLIHTSEGFHLTGCEGKLDFFLRPKASYSLYADYFWYEIGDMISIGDTKVQYYCFPIGREEENRENKGKQESNKTEKVNVAKARLAAEELYKLVGGK